MEQRIYHGDLKPHDIAQALVGKFNRGNLRSQQLGNAEQIVVQVATRMGAASGGSTAMTITLQKVEDGISVQVGKQTWLGTAASLGKTALLAIRSPFNLLGRLDDLAQDIENLQISQQVWESIEEVVRAKNASFELSERLRRLVCVYCNAANPIGEPNCVACGAPLGSAQPRTCLYCGFVLKTNEGVCPNCKRAT